ncbi:hypothetical protein INR49_015154 [Caranx melampygus]|nr:hypothetical protein INR49_015154 [Caranx melampygus]
MEGGRDEEERQSSQPILKVLLCGVERFWEHRDPLDGPGPSQDQQNQNYFLHLCNLSTHSSLRGLMPETLNLQERLTPHSALQWWSRTLTCRVLSPLHVHNPTEEKTNKLKSLCGFTSACTIITHDITMTTETTVLMALMAADGERKVTRPLVVGVNKC